MKSLNIDIKKSKYKAMIGTGGIGSGKFFLLNGDHTLGREESRSGYILDRNDYCKLHIISHYVKSLLGKDFSVIPIGKVGADDIGTNLLNEMNEAGLDVKYVESDKTKSTLFSFCFLYPDNSGGNMTTDNSASSSVDESTISNAKKEFVKYGASGIVLAVPEVPLEAREKLLEYGKQNKLLCVASFTSEEMDIVMKSDVLKNVDILAINLDEASRAAGIKAEESDSQTIIESAVKFFQQKNPDMVVSITEGKSGSWLWNGETFSHIPALELDVVNTAGAGDAFVSGLIAGVVAGLSLNEAQQLATLTGGGSVTSPHTINKEMDREMLYKIAAASSYKFSNNIYKLLEK